jgi:pseudouridine kinase
MDEGYVLVIGSAGLDVKGRAAGDLLWEQPNLGQVRQSIGGVARNIAENLARLEVDTILLSAVGKDLNGRRVLKQTSASGVDVSHVRQVKDARTSAYVAVLKSDGELMIAISDFEVIDYVDSAYLRGHEPLFAKAGMIVLDATLSDAALETVFELARRYQVRVCADPTTPTLAGRLCAYIPYLYFIVPNAAETATICGLPQMAHDRESGIQAARQLVAMGSEIAVVTMGEIGLAYADSSGGGFIPAVHTRVVDSTGAGDALTGAAIFGLINAVPLDEALRLGVTAASLTLQTPATVIPKLSQELLYDKLMI